MLIANSIRNGSIKSAIDYFFKDTNHKGEKRPYQPELLKGYVSLCMSAGRLTEKFSCQTVSGVISFKEGENLSKDEMLKVIGRFEDTFFGNMKDRVTAIYVLHKEKDSFHIHYAIPRIDLISGKYWNPFPPGQMTNDLMKSFSALENDRYGFEQVKENPLKKSSKRELLARELVERGTSKFLTKEDLSTKDSFDKACRKLVKDGVVKNRDELISFIKDSGLKLSRIGDDYISIERDGKNIRLRGGIYSSSTKDYIEIKQEYKEKVSSFDSIKTEQQLKRIVELRDTFNSKRYGAEVAEIAKTAQNSPQAKKLNSSSSTPPPSSKIAPRASIQEVISDTSEKTSSKAPISTPGTDGQPSESPTSGGSGSSGGGGAVVAVEVAKAKMANAKTAKERIQAEYELAIAMAQLEGENRDKLEQMKNKNRNGGFKL